MAVREAGGLAAGVRFPAARLNEVKEGHTTIYCRVLGIESRSDVPPAGETARRGRARALRQQGESCDRFPAARQIQKLRPRPELLYRG